MCLKLALYGAVAKEMSKDYPHQHQHKMLAITSNPDEYDVFFLVPKALSISHAQSLKGECITASWSIFLQRLLASFSRTPLSSSHLPITSKGSRAEQHIPGCSVSWISKVLALCLETAYRPGWNLSWIPADPFLPLKGSHLCPGQTITLQAICVPRP